uniref:Uncharacterized protein, isoform B n=1 Tax=Drosophila melanogaster TaxID=7227 RepID=M9PF28_DROME|nr:uncharacterized protein Dmel_CG33493, isoform B [Drosophila melanogaster]AGB94380.1 uncharacterized protein Dmel_CG33493, isoform B [Drosophila melanogaster]|eukprot:NP_001261686.1 uncharacterized protein Dmel_CG33493, isoform B [Drosophila melanogaster]
MRALQYLLLLLVISIGLAASVPRQRRQIDLTVSAEHDDNDEETELALEAIAGLWSSADSRTKIDGSASLVHRTHGTQSGSEQDFRVGVRITFDK